MARLLSAPLSLRVFAAITIFLPIVVTSFKGIASDVVVGASISFAILIALVVVLLRGSRIVWSIFFLLDASILVSDLFDPVAWWLVLSHVISLGCLIAPPSVQFVWKKPLAVGEIPAS